MNIYLSAVAGNLYVNDYTENVLNSLEGGNNFFFLCKVCDKDMYKSDNIRFLITEDGAKKGLRSVIDGLKLCRTKVCRENEPDVFVIHNANPWVILRYYPLWKKAKKRILYFWGTDINEISKRNERLLRIFLPTVTKACFTSERLRRVFLEKFGEKYASITDVRMFGMPLYRELVRIVEEKDVDTCRQRFGIPTGKISVHIGYNAPEAQQHIKIINALGSLPDEIKTKLYITIPFGYGRCGEGYAEKIEKALVDAQLEGQLLTDYLEKPATAMLRASCDIFIYGRTVDSHSFTPAEYMFTGARAIMPEWLAENYIELSAVEGYEYYMYDSFDKLSEAVREAVDRMEKAGKKEPSGLQQFREYVKETFSWETGAKKWIEDIS